MHWAVWYTDCKEVFHQAAMRHGERKAVWDYEKDLKPELKHVIDLQQGKLRKVNKLEVEMPPVHDRGIGHER